MKKQALVRSALACVAGLGYLSMWSCWRGCEADHEAYVAENYVTVITPTRNLRPHDRISPTMLTVETAPEHFVNPKAIRIEDAWQVVGKKPMDKLKEGVTILHSDFDGGPRMPYPPVLNEYRKKDPLCRDVPNEWELLPVRVVMRHKSNGSAFEIGRVILTRDFDSDREAERMGSHVMELLCDTNDWSIDVHPIEP